MDHDIGANVERSLQDWRAETIVHRKPRPRLPGDCPQARNVANFRERIGGRLDKKQLGIGEHGRAPFRKISGRNQGRRYAKTLEDIVEQLHRRTKNTARGDDMIAPGKQAHHAGKNRGHARRCSDARFRSLHRRQPLLKSRHRGVGEARVNIARLLPGKTRRRLCRILEHKAGRQIHCFRVFVELAAMRACADCLCFQFVIIRHF